MKEDAYDVEQAVADLPGRPVSAAMQTQVSNLVPGDRRHGF